MLKKSVLRSFATRRLVKAADLDADANLKAYFDTRLQAWTNQYLTVHNQQKTALSKKMTNERRSKIEQLAKLVAFLPAEERWLVTEYVQRASLQDFIAAETPSTVSQDISLMNQRRPL